MLRAGNNLILEGPTQITEIIAVPSNAHDQVAVLPGVFNLSSVTNPQFIPNLSN
jgi:hypothetical protein